ncbi:hypothetical protein GCM10022212_01440 [Actimicrobium antarcticum]|uniref:Uncharacterized protein n=1 Tax=Actimicrobium antarcticum TaxID=1051899 RepID=A0ABP7SI56_9BURK
MTFGPLQAMWHVFETPAKPDPAKARMRVSATGRSTIASYLQSVAEGITFYFS